MNYVVLLSGGKGTRMQCNEPKQHIILHHRQIIEYTLTAFTSCDQVDAILVVSNEAYIPRVIELMPGYDKLKWVIEGGENRISSVRNAVKFLQRYCCPSDKIIISDAVRPCVTTSEIEKVYQSLEHYPAVTTGVEIYETILKMEEGSISQIIPRNGIVRQTSPEGYLFSILNKLYILEAEEVIKQYQNIGIDQLLAQHYKIGYVKSNPLNFKITTQEDLQIFETVVKHGYENLIFGKSKTYATL